MPALMRRRDRGGWIDRSRPLSFSFNGKPCLGYAGDTLASALLANGADLLGRSVRYNRPRGIMAAGPEDQSAFVTLDEDGAARRVLAPLVDLYEGLSARSILDWPPPSLIDRVRGFRKRKTIETPVHEPLRRKYAASSAFDHCDVLIVGAGPAGLNAALAAGEAGARVLVVDEQPRPGGSLHWCKGAIDDAPSDAWLRDTLARLHALQDVEVLTRTLALDFDDDGHVRLVETRPDVSGEEAPASGRRYQLRTLITRQIVLASGTRERPLVFPDNDRPGVMLASSVMTYARRFSLIPASGPVAIFTNNDRGHVAACQMQEEGIDVAAVVDCRRELDANSVAQLCDRGLNLVGGAIIKKVHGDTSVAGVELMRTDGTALATPLSSLDCSVLAVCGGFNPRTELLAQAGGSVSLNQAVAALTPDNTGKIDHIAGAVTGNFSLEHAVRSGRAAGQSAARALGFDASPQSDTAPETGADDIHLQPFWETPKAGLGNRTKQWVDRRRDITTGDVTPAALNGRAPISSPLQDLQLYGMDEPDLSPVIDVAQTPPKPSRRLLPAHAWHADHRAAFAVKGGWLTPAYYQRDNGDAELAVAAEMAAARMGVAAIDLSALSKVEVRGPDSLALMEYLCCETLEPFPVDSVHYVRLLDQNGGILEHGVLARLQKDRFILTTSPTSEKNVLDWINTQLTSGKQRYRAAAVPVSAQWATLVLTGPRARQVLLELDRDIDVSTSAFPFLGLRRGKLCGIHAHIARTSNIGEVAFEIAVPANYGAPMWDALLAAGGKLGICPMGEDALTRLGAEKGRIDTPRLAPRGLTPYDLDLAGTYVPKKADFIGKQAVLDSAGTQHDRLQLVALRGDDEQGLLPEDGIIMQDGVEEGAREGRVAISFHSAALSAPVTLALLLRGKQRIGETVHVASRGTIMSARVVRPTIFDLGGRRRHG
ncbi:MAG: FAD-dependent oxidoreductase [Alphaproteobacteria bacterium]